MQAVEFQVFFMNILHLFLYTNVIYIRQMLGSCFIPLSATCNVTRKKDEDKM